MVLRVFFNFGFRAMNIHVDHQSWSKRSKFDLASRMLTYQGKFVYGGITLREYIKAEYILVILFYFIEHTMCTDISISTCVRE